MSHAVLTFCFPFFFFSDQFLSILGPGASLADGEHSMVLITAKTHTT